MDQKLARKQLTRIPLAIWLKAELAKNAGKRDDLKEDNQVVYQPDSLLGSFTLLG